MSLDAAYPYIDVHTHHPKPSAQAWCVENIFLQKAEPLPVPQPHLGYSVGLHPWHLQQLSHAEVFGRLMALGRQPQVWALGESGLDRAILTPLPTQQSVFEAHIMASETLEKPLIVHCVRAYSELIQCRKQFAPKQPWVVHAFAGNAQMADQLLRHGMYLSFGADLCQPRPKLQQALLQVPHDRLLLETDDQQAFSIEQVYGQAARLINMDPEALKRQLFDNFAAVFKKSIS